MNKLYEYVILGVVLCVMAHLLRYGWELIWYKPKPRNQYPSGRYNRTENRIEIHGRND